MADGEIDLSKIMGTAIAPPSVAENIEAANAVIATAIPHSEIAQLALPMRVRELAYACGFEVHGWHEADLASVVVQTPRDTSTLGIRDYTAANRPVVNYIGTRDEAVAFMTAWSQCVGHKVAELMREEEDNEKIRRTVICLSTYHDVEPGQSAQISMRPQRGAFRGNRIAIPKEIAEKFTIQDLKVGNLSTFETSADIPAIAFAINVNNQSAWFDITEDGSGELFVTLSRAAQEQFGRSWSMPVTQPAMDLTISIRNHSSEPSQFCALIIGMSASNW